MADTSINGTGGNDVIQAPSVGSTGSLVLVVSGTIAEGLWPTFNVLINGEVVDTVTVTANKAVGATQQVTVPLPGGTSITSVSIDYTNDPQTSFATEDRNLYVSSVNLNGTPLALSSGTYFRNGLTSLEGQEAMNWGGQLVFSGEVVQDATANIDTVFIDGLAGLDTVTFAGLRSAYSIQQTSTGYAVAGPQSAQLTNVERLDFQDIDVALDMNGNAGTTAKLIAALFGKSFLDVEQYVGVGITLLDQGMTPLQLAALAVGTAEFNQLAGSTSNTDFVKLVYRNVVGVDPSQQALDLYVGLLDSGAHTKASLGLLAAEASENQVNLVGVMQTGIEFV